MPCAYTHGLTGLGDEKDTETAVTKLQALRLSWKRKVVLQKKGFITFINIHVHCPKLRFPENYILFTAHKLTPPTQKLQWKRSEGDSKLRRILSALDM